MVAKSVTNDTNLPSLIEAFSGPYESEWEDAMSYEIKDLMERNTWTLIKKNRNCS